MATVTKFANANTVVTTGWTNPTNAYADDGSYATAAPAKNSSVTTDYGFPAFTTSDIPAGSTINSVTAEFQYKTSATGVTGELVGIQLNNNGTLLDSESTFTPATGDTTSTLSNITAVAQADLQTANQFKVRVRSAKGNTNTSVTHSVDYVKLTVDYNAPPNAPTLSSPADIATGVSTTPELDFSATDPDSDAISYEVEVDTVNTFDSSGGGTIDSYTTTPTTPSATGAGGTPIGNGMSFTGDGNNLGSVIFSLKKFGSPTGIATMRIYAHTGTFGSTGTPTGSAIATSDTNLDVSTLTSSFVDKTFTFSGSNQITLSNGTHYFAILIYSGGDLSNDVAIGAISSGTASGNSAHSTDLSSWTVNSVLDFYFIVKQPTSPLIDATSASGGHDAAQFVDLTNGADTDPFASGDSMSFTVPGGETLIASTQYFWRVRGKDPSGSNTFGSWSSTRSFTTGSSGTVLTSTQSAVARIANNITKTQSAVARIQRILTKTQSAVGRIANTLTKTQPAVARIANNFTKTQTATARIQRVLTFTQPAKAAIQQTATKTQSAVSRIANTFTLTQSAKARIQTIVTKTQPATARIQNIITKTQAAKAAIQFAGLTKTQSAIARVANTLTKTQSAVARIANSPTKTQSAKARIANIFTKTQSAVARVQHILTFTQSATARIANVRTLTQTAVANIIQSGALTKTQTAIARIANDITKTQSALARIAVNLTKTQSVIARIANVKTKAQSAIASVMVFVSKTQPATARVANIVTKTQSAIARIAQIYTKTQSAVARIANNLTKTQSATSRIANTFTKTQGAVGRIAVNSTITQPAKATIANNVTQTQPAVSRISSVLSLTQSATAHISGGTTIRTFTQSAKASIATNIPGPVVKIIMLTDGRLALKLSNTLYLPL